MDFFVKLIDNLGAVVVLLGVFTGAVGGIQYGMAHSRDEAAGKTAATNVIVGGAIIVIIGVVMMPLISGYLPSV